MSLAMRVRMKDPTEKLVLLAFADHVNEDGLSFPSVDLVAAEALCSGRTVQRIVKRFVDVGLLQVYRRGSGRGYPTMYRVIPDALGPIASYDELRESQRAASHPPATEHSSDALEHPQADLLLVDNSAKGDTMASPFPPVDKIIKGDKSGLKGDTQVSPEPITFNHKERANARDVDNFRAAGAQDPPDRCHPSDRKKQPPASQRTDQQQPSNSYNPATYRETLEQITEKARQHALAPRKKWENEFAFRNRVNVGVINLTTLANDAKRLKIKNRRPQESLEDFEIRVTKQAMRSKGMASDLTPEQARKHALATR